MTWVNNRPAVIGGYFNWFNNAVLNSVEVLEENWKESPSLVVARSCCTACFHKGKSYVFCGR